jgi:hypothetical protein
MVVAATVVGGSVIGGCVVGGSVMGGCVVGGSVMGGCVVGGSVMGGCVVGGSVIGGGVVGIVGGGVVVVRGGRGCVVGGEVGAGVVVTRGVVVALGTVGRVVPVVVPVVVPDLAGVVLPGWATVVGGTKKPASEPLPLAPANGLVPGATVVVVAPAAPDVLAGVEVGCTAGAANSIGVNTGLMFSAPVDAPTPEGATVSTVVSDAASRTLSFPLPLDGSPRPMTPPANRTAAMPIAHMARRRT